MKSNIAIISMVKSMNNQVAELLSDSLDMHYLDTDGYIAYEYTMPVSQLVAEYDEEFFYKAESKKLAALKDFDEMVLAVSPSALINLDNMRVISEYAYIIALKPSTKIGRESVKEAFEADDSLYLKYALRNNYGALENNFFKAAENYADVTVNTDGIDNAGIVKKVIRSLGKLYR